jgi:hypothetical protein
MNLKYCLDPRFAEERYEKNKKLMVQIPIKRPPDLEIMINLPLGTDLNWKKDIDKDFPSFVTK